MVIKDYYKILGFENNKVNIEQIKNAINNKTLDEEVLNKHTLRVLAWKYYKGLL